MKIVVHAPAPAVHGDRDTRVFEDTGEAEAGELAALVGVGITQGGGLPLKSVPVVTLW